MTQEEKDLLLKDLCGRLPYGVKCYKITFKPELAEEVICMLRNGSHNCVQLGTFLYRLEHIKPYLFPLSSMTEEQREEFLNIQTEERQILLNALIEYKSGKYDKIPIIAPYKQIEWLNKNHFDYRDLIERGLAIDCTNLNIY